MNTSSSIFNFDLAAQESESRFLWIQSAVEKLDSLGSLNYSELIFSLILTVIPVLLGILVWKKCRGTQQIIFGTAIAIFLFRGLLFGNPVGWLAYRTLFDWQDIGFREKAVIDFEIRNYIQPGPHIEFLALGSSQTGAIYQNLARDRKDFYKIEFAGMNAVDLYLYSNILDEVRPKRLLLFVSEFDLAREAELATLKYAPMQSIDKYQHVADFLSRQFGWSLTINTLTKMALANIMPESKHRYIPLALIDKLAHKRSLTVTAAETFEKKSREDVTQEQVQGLEKSLRLAPIEDNFEFLELFVKYAVQQNIEVYLVEGQYHPAAYTAHTMSLNRKVKTLLVELGSLDGAYFIPRDKSYIFTSEDFIDGYHPNPIAADRFTEKLLKYLASIDGNVQSKGT